jgi:hypothetical protein
MLSRAENAGTGEFWAAEGVAVSASVRVLVLLRAGLTSRLVESRLAGFNRGVSVCVVGRDDGDSRGLSEE